MKGFYADLEKQTLDNNNFRHVLYTAPYSQIVLMSLRPNEEIGMERHGNDQFFRIEKGQGQAIIDGNEYALSDGESILVPSGAEHNVINTSSVDDLKLYTVYAVPHHKDQVKYATKAEADASTETFDGVTTESRS
jgi:mannose-6-phosphate isomerase-like protein (cupin superfamily)